MNETSGILRPAIERYLNNEPMTDADIAAMRAYLRQWMAGPWLGISIPQLRSRIDGLTSRAAIADWLADALVEDIDPL
jgi:N-acyl-D-aspartate/D-glutamate deacylase